MENRHAAKKLPAENPGLFTELSAEAVLNGSRKGRWVCMIMCFFFAGRYV